MLARLIALACADTKSAAFARRAGRARPRDQARSPAEYIADGLRGEVRIETLSLPADGQDGLGEAFWARPEAYQDPRIRAGMSAFKLLGPASSCSVRRKSARACAA